MQSSINSVKLKFTEILLHAIYYARHFTYIFLFRLYKNHTSYILCSHFTTVNTKAPRDQVFYPSEVTELGLLLSKWNQEALVSDLSIVFNFLTEKLSVR